MAQPLSKKHGTSKLALIGVFSTLIVLWLSGSFWYEAFMLRKDAIVLKQSTAFESNLYDLAERISTQRGMLFAPANSIDQPTADAQIDGEPVLTLISDLQKKVQQLLSDTDVDDNRTAPLTNLKYRAESLYTQYELILSQRKTLSDTDKLDVNSEAQIRSMTVERVALFQRYVNFSKDISALFNLVKSVFLPRKNDSEFVTALQLRTIFWELKEATSYVESLANELNFLSAVSEQHPSLPQFSSERALAAETMVRYHSAISERILQLRTTASADQIPKPLLRQIEELENWHGNEYNPALQSLLGNNLQNRNSIDARWEQICSQRTVMYEEIWHDTNQYFNNVTDSVLLKSNRNLVIDSVLLIMSLIMGLWIYQAIRTIKFQAEHDSLTLLPNRLSFYPKLYENIEQADTDKNKLALIIIDLEKFKLINDTLGYAVGNNVLKAVAFRLNQLKDENFFPARLGGDEFTALFVCNSEYDAQQQAMNIRNHLAEQIIVDGRSFDVGACVGMALYPDHATQGEELQMAADFAMLTSRAEDSASVAFYSAEMASKLQYKIEIESELIQAIAQDELELHYQPKFNTAKACVNSLEALVRWNHPLRGFMSPGEFLSIAETSGYMPLLGDWVLRAAIRQAAIWNKTSSHPISVAVNVAANQFVEDHFAKKVEQHLAEFDLQADLLEIEITESLLLQDLDNVLIVLKELRSMGIKIAMDDFGTGYSSLSLLHSLPLDTLKIDRSFVSRLNNTENPSTTVTSTIVNMARAYGLEIVAEGAETEEEVTILMGMEVDYIQGFYYSKPVPAQDVPDVMNSIADFANQSRVA